MKDRIRQLMESQHMNQQSFASFLGIAPATLSSVLAERTQPTLKLVQIITKKMPKVNLFWLLEGSGEMFTASSAPAPGGSPAAGTTPSLFPDFDDAAGAPLADAQDPASPSAHPGGVSPADFADMPQAAPSATGGRSQSPTRARAYGGYGHNIQGFDVKNIDKQPRKITEIRVFYDDQTWESFVPKK